MKKGTQAMLDAAKNDATLLPYGVKFKTNGVQYRNIPVAPTGSIVHRSVVAEYNDPDTVRVTDETGEQWYVCAAQLDPIKKDKPKKWQNGTQSQLDAAKDDARLIPKKTYFRHKEGYWWVRADCEENDATQVLVVSWEAGLVPRMVCASDLVPA